MPFLFVMRVCSNGTNHVDVMLSDSEASRIFQQDAKKQILRPWLRMTL